MMEMNYLQTVLLLNSFGDKICNAALAEEPMQNLMKSKEKYDIIIVENFFSECFLGYAHIFKAPVVQISTFAGTEDQADIVGNPTPYSYIPDPFQEFDQNMDFKQRLMNTLGYLVQKVAKKFSIRRQNEIMRKFFHDPDMPSLEELQKSTALVLVNHHFSIGSPRPLLPNYVMVGGMHIKPPKKLPTVSNIIIIIIIIIW